MAQVTKAPQSQPTVGEIEGKIIKYLKLSLAARSLADVSRKLGESLEVITQHAGALRERGLLDYDAEESKIKLSPQAWLHMRQTSE
jgi:DNA-binding transcriptional ArsR family regulator